MMDVRVSIVMPVRESYEMVRRQVLYINSLGLPPEIEVIIVDDGSNPKIILYDEPDFKYELVYREDEQYSGWTIPRALNFGAKGARGEFLMFLGIDLMLSPELIKFALTAKNNYAVFKRKYALLLEDGTLLKILYYGKDFDAEYGKRVLEFVKKIYPKLEK